MAGITREDWLAALAEAGIASDEDDQQALTVEEFAKMFGLHRTTAATQLKALAGAGKATVTRKWATSSYGRRIQYIAYRLTNGQANSA